MPGFYVHSELYVRGVHLFNQSEFYEAHEVLEDVWRASTGPEKLFLQGLIQVAVALHHHSTGNIIGARSLLGRALKNLNDYPEIYCDLCLQEFRSGLYEWRSALEQGRPLATHPHMRLRSQNIT